MNPYATDDLAALDSVLIAGTRTSFRVGGGGPPLMLIHGSGPGNDGELTWRPIVAQLAKSFRTIVVDAPGYGESDMMDAADTPANVGLHLLRLATELGIDAFAVAGHSRGGRIATEMALADPGRISRLVVLSSGAVAPLGILMEDGEFSPSAASLVRFGADGDTSFEQFCKAYWTMVCTPEHLPVEVLRVAYQRFMATRMDEYLRRMQAFDPLAFYANQDPTDLTAVKVPTCLIWGREDVTSPWKRAVALLDLIPDVELHVLPRCSHFVTADRPTDVIDLMTGYLTRIPIVASQ